MAENKKASKKELTFEAAMKELDEVSEKLSDGTLTLDESLALYSKSVKLIAFCREKLEDAEKKINIVTDMETGSTKSFADEE